MRDLPKIAELKTWIAKLSSSKYTENKGSCEKSTDIAVSFISMKCIYKKIICKCSEITHCYMSIAPIVPVVCEMSTVLE